MGIQASELSPANPRPRQWAGSREDRRSDPPGLDVLCLLPAQGPAVPAAQGEAPLLTAQQSRTGIFRSANASHPAGFLRAPA